MMTQEPFQVDFYPSFKIELEKLILYLILVYSIIFIYQSFISRKTTMSNK